MRGLIGRVFMSCKIIGWGGFIVPMIMCVLVALLLILVRKRVRCGVLKVGNSLNIAQRLQRQNEEKRQNVKNCKFHQISRR